MFGCGDGVPHELGPDGYGAGFGLRLIFSGSHARRHALDLRFARLSFVGARLLAALLLRGQADSR